MNLKLNDLFKKELKNKSGSALPFVLIIGLIMMILVGSLTAVAVGGIQFTQESVESRQAYLDAKSVIEFARIEINDNYETTKAAYTFSKDKSTFIRPVGGPLFYVYGVPRTSAGDDSKLRRVEIGNSGNPGEVRLGTAVLVEDFNDPGTKVTDITLQYHYEIMTENLERQLNYKTGFSYQYKSNGGGGGGTYPVRPAVPALPDLKVLQANGMPQLSDAKAISSPICEVQFTNYSHEKKDEALFYTITPTGNPIYGTKNNGNWELNIQKSGDLKLTYTGLKQNTKLTIAADNIETTNLPTTNFCEYHIDAAGTLYINQPLVVKNGCKVYLNANKIIVNGGITVENGGFLSIGSKVQSYCVEGLYVKGEVSYKSQNSGINIINAKNIYIGGSLKTPSTSLNIIKKNLWIQGSLELDSFDYGVSKIEKITSESDGIVWIGKNYSVGPNQTTKAELTAESVYVNNIYIGDTSTITATNLVVLMSGINNALNCKSGSKSVFNCPNVWFKGPITTNSSGAALTFNQVHYFESATMNLNSGTNFTINGSTNKDNQFIVNGQVNNIGTGCLFSINDVYWFECNYLYFENNSKIDINAQVVMIKKDTNGNNGGLRLKRGDSSDKSIFDVQYLFVDGPTEITGGAAIVTRFTNTNENYPGKCNIIFKGGYKQGNTLVSIENAENIVMQGELDFETNCRLSLQADQIYFDSDHITHGDWGKSTVAYGGIAQGTGTNFYTKSDIKWTDSKTGYIYGGYPYDIKPGLYTNVLGASLKELVNTPTAYQPPGTIKPPYPGTSVNNETGEVVAINNSSIYY